MNRNEPCGRALSLALGRTPPAREGFAWLTLRQFVLWPGGRLLAAPRQVHGRRGRPAERGGGWKGLARIRQLVCASRKRASPERQLWMGKATADERQPGAVALNSRASKQGLELSAWRKQSGVKATIGAECTHSRVWPIELSPWTLETNRERARPAEGEGEGEGGVVGAAWA